MTEIRNVAVLVGSLRKESFNRKMALALAELSGAQLKFNFIEIADLSLYNQDLDEAPPQTWVAFREKVKGNDAVLFVTPEYNRSVPGVLKNAIDIGSRPYGKSVWNGKPGAVVSVSLGAIGGFGANHHLRQSLVFLNVPAMPQPELYVGNAADLFDADGKVKNETTRGLAQKFADAFASWIAVNAPSKGA